MFGLRIAPGARLQRRALFSGSAGLDGDGVDPVSRNVAECRIDEALALKARNACESGTFDFYGEVRFAGAVIAGVTGVAGGIVDDIKAGGGEGGFEKLPHFLCDRSGHVFHLRARYPIWKPVRHSRFHGRVESGGRACNWPGCEEAGEFRAPGMRLPGFDGPGDYRWFCLDHVREFNSGYDYFDGMSAEEIFRAQSPLHGWEAQSRAFRPDAGVDGTPRWADFADPLEAISGRAKAHMRQRQAEMKPENARFNPEERRALGVLGLDGDIDSKTLRLRYTRLLRQYHPDHNGGDHSRAARLQGVVEAYQLLRKSAALGG